jgi:hypothetical protein
LAGRIIIREPEPGDTEALAAFMRQADHDEVVASHGPDVLATLDHALRISTHALTVLDAKGCLACVMGTAPINMAAGIGCPWMLGTYVLDRLPRTLMRVSRRYFDEVARVYPVLENYVDVRNTASIRLLAWLGCSFDEPQPYGVSGLPFMRFELRSGESDV